MCPTPAGRYAVLPFNKLFKGVDQHEADAGSSIQELIGRLHQEVTEEYVRRLLRGDLRLKAREQQEMACAVMINNAESLRKLFTKEVKLRPHRYSNNKQQMMQISAELKLK